MRLTHLRPTDYKTMPWKNGGGVTTELMAEPNGEGGHLWRLSIAEVAKPGPFSDFSGYDRTIMLIDGAGFVLEFDRQPAKRIDRAFEPFPFDGGWRTHCTLIDGPIRDFNLMSAQGAATAELRVETLDRGGVQIAAADTVVCYALEGDASVSGHGLSAGDTLRVDQPILPLSLDAHEAATIAVIRIGF